MQSINPFAFHNFQATPPTLSIIHPEEEKESEDPQLEELADVLVVERPQRLVSDSLPEDGSVRQPFEKGHPAAEPHHQRVRRVPLRDVDDGQEPLGDAR